MTSLPAGKVVPMAVIPLLREDDLRARLAMAFEMQETHEVLLNGVDVVVEAWCVPNLALQHKFRTMDDINLAFTGNARPGDQPVPFFDTMVQPADPLTNQIHMRLGKHVTSGKRFNMAYIQAYNTAVNFARAEVSPAIPQREINDMTLAQALWPKNNFMHIVPDFDQAVQEGEVALSVAEQNLRLKGAIEGRYVNVGAKAGTFVGTKDQFGTARPMNITTVNGSPLFTTSGGNNAAVADVTGLRADLEGAVAELADNGITISLNNIKMAQKAQVFANLRKKYNGLTEDMLVDLLMDGISIPEQQWRQPMLLSRASTRFGMSKRYSGDADALTESVVNGAAAVEFSINVPRCPSGGVVIIMAYIAPEQLFERQADPYLLALEPDDLPHTLPDILDPEQVTIVKNSYIDQDHDNPDDIYGYAPQHHEWNTSGPGIGGRFFRPEVDAGFDEDRNALWAVETQNPTLTKDAYLVPADIHLKPFWTSTIDPFDCITLGEGTISGLTQFGPMLIEALPKSDYDAIMERVDTSRIEKEPVAP